MPLSSTQPGSNHTFDPGGNDQAPAALYVMMNDRTFATIAAANDHTTEMDHEPNWTHMPTCQLLANNVHYCLTLENLPM